MNILMNKTIHIKHDNWVQHKEGFSVIEIRHDLRRTKGALVSKSHSENSYVYNATSPLH